MVRQKMTHTCTTLTFSFINKIGFSGHVKIACVSKRGGKRELAISVVFADKVHLPFARDAFHFNPLPNLENHNDRGVAVNAHRSHKAMCDAVNDEKLRAEKWAVRSVADKMACWSGFCWTAKCSLWLFLTYVVCEQSVPDPQSDANLGRLRKEMCCEVNAGGDLPAQPPWSAAERQKLHLRFEFRIRFEQHVFGGLAIFLWVAAAHLAC
jgi:hypothetical protein